MTQRRAARVSPEFEQAVRERLRGQHPELADSPISLLIRVGLAVLAGWSVKEAVAALRGSHNPHGSFRLPGEPVKDDRHEE